jgi:PHD/YefM family antitoxin component YafN of YafNO toxin-antitoxin module
MDDLRKLKESLAAYAALTTDLSQPVILERDGQPIAALISIEDYERYQVLLKEREIFSARAARRAADRAVFGDLVGCALSSGDPIWIGDPEPRWRIPYRSFSGTLLAEVDVDARTLAVSLTDVQRTALLEKVEQLVTAGDASA